MSSESFPDKDHWEKTASRYLDVARASAATTSTVAILWLVFVSLCILSFHYEVERLKAEIREVKEEIQNSKERLRRFEEQNEEIAAKKQVTKKKIKIKHDLALLSNEERKIQCRKERNKAIQDKENLLYCYVRDHEEAEAKLNKLLEDKKVKFQLPALPSFKLFIFVAPVVLSFILLGLAFYMKFMRDRTFTYLGRALHILRGMLQIPSEKIEDVMGPRNWWIVPLPKISHPTIDSGEFARALGWSYSSPVPLTLTIFFWSTHIILQCYLISLSIYLFIHLFGESAGVGINILINFILMIFFLVITIALIISWFRPDTVSGEILRSEEEIEKGRRYFFTAIGKGSAIALILNAVITYPLSLVSFKDTRLLYSPESRNVIARAFRNPRFRKKREPFVSIKPYQLRGLLLYPFTKPSAYVTNMAKGANKDNLVGMRRSQFPKKFKLDLLKKLEPSELIHDSSIYINRSIVSVSYELAAKELFDKSSWSKTAFKVLMTGMKQDLEYKQHAKLSRVINGHRRKPRKKKQNLPKTVTRRLNSNENPIVSVRLYDLFAKEAVRNKQPELIKQQLIPFINDNKLASVFEHRMTKWTNPESKWYRDLMKYGLRSSNVG